MNVKKQRKVLQGILLRNLGDVIACLGLYSLPLLQQKRAD